MHIHSQEHGNNVLVLGIVKYTQYACTLTCWCNPLSPLPDIQKHTNCLMMSICREARTLTVLPCARPGLTQVLGGHKRQCLHSAMKDGPFALPCSCNSCFYAPSVPDVTQGCTQSVLQLSSKQQLEMQEHRDGPRFSMSVLAIQLFLSITESTAHWTFHIRYCQLGCRALTL